MATEVSSTTIMTTEPNHIPEFHAVHIAESLFPITYNALELTMNYSLDNFQYNAIWNVELAFPYLTAEQQSQVLEAMKNMLINRSIQENNQTYEVNDEEVPMEVNNEKPSCEECGNIISGHIFHDDVFRYDFCSTYCVRRFIE